MVLPSGSVPWAVAHQVQSCQAAQAEVLALGHAVATSCAAVATAAAVAAAAVVVVVVVVAVVAAANIDSIP